VRLARERFSSAVANRITTVKVFSATVAKDRGALGERVTAWLRALAGVVVISVEVVQSSDASFHCLTIVLFCADA
jgi:hypothetical protein